MCVASHIEYSLLEQSLERGHCACSCFCSNFKTCEPFFFPQNNLVVETIWSWCNFALHITCMKTIFFPKKQVPAANASIAQ